MVRKEVKGNVQNKYDTNKVSARTHIRDLETVKQIEKTCKDIINLPIQKITVNHIRKVLPNLTIYSNNSIDKIYRLINKTFKIAVSDRLIAFNPMENPEQMIFSLGDVYPQLGGTSFWEMVKVNLVTGQLASLNWAWCYGRVFQTAALFMIGLLLGRLGYFDASSEEKLEKSRTFWIKVLCLSLPATLLMYYLKEFIYTLVEIKFMLSSLQTILNSWYNLFFMLGIVASFLLLYWT